MENYNELIRSIKNKGIYPLDLFKLFMERELKMASRFRYPLCFIRIKTDIKNKNGNGVLEVISKNIRTYIDLLSDYGEDGECYIVSPYSNLTVSFIIVERIKLVLESVFQDWDKKINISGVEVDENSSDISFDKLAAYCKRIAKKIDEEQGTGTRIYTINDIKNGLV